MARAIQRISTVVLAVVNHKGGVGKTTTAVNLAAALAATNRKILLVDLDSQASASLSLGVTKAGLEPSAAEALFWRKPMRPLVRPSGIECLDLLTGSPDLANADLTLSDVSGREHALKSAIAPLRREYIYIILDCPPSLSLLAVNALVAAHAFIVPVTPQYLALEGLVNFLEAVARIRHSVRSSGSLLGVLLTMVDYRTKAAAEIVDMIRGHYRDLVFNTEIATSASLAEAPSFGKSIFQYAPSSRGADCYRRLSGEVLQRTRQAFT